MIIWNVPLQRKLIEQRSLLDLPMSHHIFSSAQRLNQRTACFATQEFFNRTDPERTVVAVCAAMDRSVVVSSCYDDLLILGSRTKLVRRREFIALVGSATVT
jgi:hypothetical protein